MESIHECSIEKKNPSTSPDGTTPELILYPTTRTYLGNVHTLNLRYTGLVDTTYISKFGLGNVHILDLGNDNRYNRLFIKVLEQLHEQRIRKNYILFNKIMCPDVMGQIRQYLII
jgi:hypothetical protein